MRLNREQLLRSLEAVAPGLATREAIEQSSCFVFQDGRVITFNDEIACSIDCEVGLDGAVAAKPLMDLLGKMTEEIINFEPKGGEVLVSGKRRRAGITLEADISLPVDSVEVPTEWNQLDPEFADAVAVVQQCASKDANQFALTCIHITPDCVEACDNFQLARYPLDTGVTKPCLVKRDSLKHVSGLGMTEVSETRVWIHFRNPSGLVLSVRREVMAYQELDAILDVAGTPTTLPGGLSEAIERAEIFSGENSDNNVLVVVLKDNELRLRGVGATGWFEERKKVKWEGKPLRFNIAPKLLLDITEKTNDCFITEGRLKVDGGGKFTYVTCLGKED
jgi:hypothetical protein